MKKIISFLTAASLCCSLSVPAFASGIAGSMNAIETNGDSINIIYNGQLMTYTDAIPENINDRIMLPFRTVLETMGASVDYDDDTRLVTAARGDITITFTLEDDTIYINKNGEKSQITLDVPMIIKNDRTLVPIRFISNALGMQIGWEGDYQTVLIVDADSYIDQLTSNAPNLMAISESNQAVYNTGSLDLSLDLDFSDLSIDELYNTFVDLSLDFKTADNVSDVSGKISADLTDLGINTAAVSDAAIDIVAANGKLYFKTDLAEQLLSADPDDLTSKLIAETISGDRWFYIDVNELLDNIDFIPESAKNIYKQIFSGDLSSLANITLPDMVKTLISSDGDATLESALQTDILIDTYIALDKYITVTDDSVEIKMNNDILTEILRAADVPEDIISQTFDLFTFGLDAYTSYTDAQADSKVTMNIEFNDDVFSLNLLLDCTQISKYDENAAPADIPENAVDLISLAGLIN